MPFLFSLSTWFSYYPIKNHPPKEKTKKNWAKCSAGLNKTTRFANQPAVTRPGKIQLSVILCGIAYPFLLYVKFTNWNVPKVFKKNTLILRGACITTICLTTQSLQPTDKKLLQKKKPLPWLSQNNQDPYADDYDKYTPWQRNEEKIKTLRAVAKIVAEAIFFRPLLAWLVKRSVQTRIVITKVKTTVSFEPRLDRNLWWWSEQPPQNIW